MARNATEVRVNEINILLKKLAARRTEYVNIGAPYLGRAISEAIRLLGERKKEVRAAAIGARR